MFKAIYEKNLWSGEIKGNEKVFVFEEKSKGYFAPSIVRLTERSQSLVRRKQSVITCEIVSRRINKVGGRKYYEMPEAQEMTTWTLLRQEVFPSMLKDMKSQ